MIVDHPLAASCRREASWVTARTEDLLSLLTSTFCCPYSSMKCVMFELTFSTIAFDPPTTPVRANVSMSTAHKMVTMELVSVLLGAALVDRKMLSSCISGKVSVLLFRRRWWSSMANPSTQWMQTGHAVRCPGRFVCQDRGAMGPLTAATSGLMSYA